jgi:hypothetical protein
MYYRILLSLIVFCVVPTLYCQAEDEAKQLDEANAAMSNIRTWSDLQQWEAKYSKYDDGWLAEGIADIEEKFLTKNWLSIKQLQAEISRHPEFEAQVMSHIGEIFSCDGCRFVVSKAETQCSTNCEGLCKKISQALRQHAALQCLPNTDREAAKVKNAP